MKEEVLPHGKGDVHANPPLTLRNSSRFPITVMEEPADSLLQRDDFSCKLLSPVFFVPLLFEF